VARCSPSYRTGTAAPADHAYPVVGDVRTVRDLFDTLGQVLGREVRYQEVSDEEWKAGALAVGINEHAAEHLSNLWRTLRTASEPAGPVPFQVTDTIEMLGGVQPRMFETFVREQRHALSGDAAPPARRSREGS
jgi:uncharacterized protein YbjT (DUF2867 family)